MTRRDEERKYRGDVDYEVWRSGGDVDRIDYDRVTDRFYEGSIPEDAAASELRRQHPQPKEEQS
jgi:hypothetical protein